MGIYSSVTISREEAESAIKEAAENLDKYSDQELEDVLFGIFSNKVLYNYRIVPEDQADISSYELVSRLQEE